jgi:hypothetical protein
MKRLYDVDINEYKKPENESIKLQAPKKDFLRSVYDDFEVNEEDFPEFFPSESKNEYPTLQSRKGDFEYNLDEDLENE